MKRRPQVLIALMDRLWPKPLKLMGDADNPLIPTAQSELDLSALTDDEIKTTAGNLDALTRTENPLHWGQAKVYAYLYATVNALDAIEVQLTYNHLDTDEIRERYNSPKSWGAPRQLLLLLLALPYRCS